MLAALFALGVMSIGWMALIAAFIAAEKLLPWKALANRGVALALVALAVGVAAAPNDVPGLTLPDSPQAARAMDAMGMEGEATNGGMSDQGGMSGDDSMNGGDGTGAGMDGGGMP